MSETITQLKAIQTVFTPTIYFYTLGHDLKSHHSVVMSVDLLQLLPVEVQDEGQVVVQVKLWQRKQEKTRQNLVPCRKYKI